VAAAGLLPPSWSPSSAKSPSSANADKELKIVITNAHPGYQCKTDVNVKNVGTIPVKLLVKILDKKTTT
jgi:hypothetical protein